MESTWRTRANKKVKCETLFGTSSAPHYLVIYWRINQEEAQSGAKYNDAPNKVDFSVSERMAL